MKASEFRAAWIAVIVCSGSSLAHGQVADEPQLWNGNGHYYQFVQTPGISWIDANTDAESRTITDAEGNALQGHLLTLLTPAESSFINGLLASRTGQGVWIGGFQSRGATAPDEDWEWVNGDGRIPAPLDPQAAGYRQWAMGEPNETIPVSNILYQEDFLALWMGAWYSEGFSATPSLDGYVIDGYVVEYDGMSGGPVDTVVIDPESCKPDSADGGCYTIPEQKLTIPETATVDEGATMEFHSYRFEDPRSGSDGRCWEAGGAASRRSLDVFSELDPYGDPTLNGRLIIPEYLCGSPNFAVVMTKVTGVTINEGTVRVENQTLPDNLFGCMEPIDPGTDPQNQDTVVWQATNEAGMLEEAYNSHYQSTVGRSWEGSVGEFTTGCGSSEGETAGLSFFVIGLHIDFGQNYDSNTAGVIDEFAALAKYKLLLLIDAIDNAQSALDEDDYKKLRNYTQQSYEELIDGDYDKSLYKIEKVLKRVEEADYAISDFNHYGAHRARGANIEFLLREKIIPFAP